MGIEKLASKIRETMKKFPGLVSINGKEQATNIELSYSEPDKNMGVVTLSVETDNEVIDVYFPFAQFQTAYQSLIQEHQAAKAAEGERIRKEREAKAQAAQNQ